MKQIYENSVFINFNDSYCTTSEEVLGSELFYKMLGKFFDLLERKKPSWWINYRSAIEFSNKDELVDVFVHLFKTLLVFDIKDIENPLINNKISLSRFVEEFYNYWRRHERYLLFYEYSHNGNIKAHNLINSDQKFNNLILQTYRHISENIMENRYLVYRQLSAGSNAALILTSLKLNVPSSYNLDNISVVNSIVLHPPFIVYPKNTKRDGIFNELKENPLTGKINQAEYFCYPIYVGKQIAFVYFHQKYVSLGVALANLFAPCPYHDYKDRKPDCVFIYGIDSLQSAGFYKDIENDIYMGFVPKNDESTYFGYMKKMLLTLHNLRCIDNHELPLHGAMVSILFINQKRVNIAFIGDSGAGKSETLEALRTIADEEIAEMIVIFDDMGYLKLEDNKIKAYGTEIGAFVRLDDLESGYAYKEMDRSIFMNPDRHNARAIIPISDYRDIVQGYEIDFLLYANNYDHMEEIRFFKDKAECISCFREGKRMALQTTTEKGLVTSYFANPFGPLQRKEKCDELLNLYFGKLIDDEVVLGELFTRLGIENCSRSGPLDAAKKLLKLIK